MNYAATAPFQANSLYERMYSVIQLVMLTLFIGFGIHLKGIKPVSQRVIAKISGMKTEFLVQEKKPSPEKKKAAAVKPLDLTTKPVIKETIEDIHKKEAEKPPVRRIYGLRKVYSKGIGTGGAMADAVIGKLGNTIQKEFDTISATQEEIKGEIVSVTTITSAPKFRKVVKPAYTEEMLSANVEGVVKVKVVVDVDGKVKNAQVLNDLGHGAATQALKACLDMEFEPAQRDGSPVAVWIVIPVRFMILT